MRISWVTACALSAWTCAQWATDLAPQYVFAPDYTWIWWLPAFAWTLTAIGQPWGRGDD